MFSFQNLYLPLSLRCFLTARRINWMNVVSLLLCRALQYSSGVLIAHTSLNGTARWLAKVRPPRARCGVHSTITTTRSVTCHRSSKREGGIKWTPTLTLSCTSTCAGILRHVCTCIWFNVFQSGPNFIELMKQTIVLNCFSLSKNKPETSHKCNIWDGILAGNLVLASMILLGV